MEHIYKTLVLMSGNPDSLETELVGLQVLVTGQPHWLQSWASPHYSVANPVLSLVLVLIFSKGMTSC